MELRVQEGRLDQQDLQERVGQVAQDPLALLDQGVHLGIWESLGLKVLLVSLDIVTLLHVLLMVWELPIRISQNSPLCKMRKKPWDCGPQESDWLQETFEVLHQKLSRNVFQRNCYLVCMQLGEDSF